MSRRMLLNLVLVLAVLLTLGVSMASAAPPSQKGMVYTVKLGDCLWWISEKYLGVGWAWPAIMASTNQKNIEDPTFARIGNADLIHPGWKLWIPSKEEAEAFLAVYRPDKVELLFGKRAKGQLVVASWWTAGGEAEGLKGLFDIYASKYPDVEIVNAAVAGGGGVVFKAVLPTRLAGGDPPDAFQVHAGLEILMYSPELYLQTIDDLYAAQGWDKVLPKDLLTLLQYEGHYWSVPVNIHRGNVLWYNKKIFADAGLTPPTNFDEFFAVCEALKAKGIIPYGFGNAGGWEDYFTFESFLVGTLGAEGYKGLWTGAVPWTDPKVTQALETYKKSLTYANPDHAALSWDSAAQLIVDGKAAMFIHGDWANGYFIAKGFTGYGWAPAPGSTGIFHVISDAFTMPKGVKNPENAKNWLIVAGSKAGQEAFNLKKGSICARTDCDVALFTEYQKWATNDFATNALVPGTDAAASPKWVTAFKDIMALFSATGDVAAAQAALQQACVDAGVCK